MSAPGQSNMRSWMPSGKSIPLDRGYRPILRTGQIGTMCAVFAEVAMMQRRNGAPTPCDAGALSQMSERRQSDRGVADGANVAVGGLIALEHVGVAQGQHSRAQSVLTSSKHVLAQSPPIHWRVQSMSER